jgi:hypothetical protein
VNKQETNVKEMQLAMWYLVEIKNIYRKKKQKKQINSNVLNKTIYRWKIRSGVLSL